MSSPPIFIVGCPRSGNTLLACILCRHPELFIFFERSVFGSVYRNWYTSEYRKAQVPSAEAFARIVTDTWEHWIDTRTSLRVREDEIRTRLKENGDETYGEMVNRCMTMLMHQVKPDASRWGDKTPRHVGSMEEIQAAYPTAQFVHIRRDPRSVVTSLSKPKFLPVSDDPLFNADFIRQYWEEYKRQKRRIDTSRLYEIRYESLVQSPESELESLCNFLGVSYTPHLLREADPEVRRATGWSSYKGWGPLQTSLASPPEIDDVVQAALVDIAEEMGYSVERNGAIPRLRATIRTAPVKLLHWVLSQAYRRRYPVANGFFMRKKVTARDVWGWIWE